MSSWSGTLQGASPPPLHFVAVPKEVKSCVKSFKIKVPVGKKSGDSIPAAVPGSTPFWVTVPHGKVAGDTFISTVVKLNTESVYASTLQSLPGMVTVVVKPIIFASASKVHVSQMHLSETEKIGILMKQANAMILEQALRCKCNAVLGMAFNVAITHESHSVTVVGTPCVVVKNEELVPSVTVTSEMMPSAPIAETHLIVEPMILSTTSEQRIQMSFQNDCTSVFE